MSKKEFIDIHKLAFPILCNYALLSLFDVLDRMIVGHYSVQGFALVGIASSIIYSITGALGLLSSAFHIIAADSKGKKDEKTFEQIFITSKLLSVLLGLLFILISILFGAVFFRNFYGFEGVQLAQLLAYFHPASITLLQNMLLFQYSAYFRNQLNTRIGVVVTLVSTGVNLFLDYALVYGQFGFAELGVSGAAWGSVAGLCCGLLLYQIAYFKRVKYKMLKKAIKEKHKLLKYTKQMLYLYSFLLGQEFLESSIFVLIVTMVVSRMGTVQIAAYHLLDTVCNVIALPAFAYACAAQTYALQYHSANQPKQVKGYLKAGVYSGLFAVGLLCIGCGIGGNSILQWIVPNAVVIALANCYLWFLFLIAPAKVIYQVSMTYLQGIGCDRYVFLCTAIGTVVIGVFVVVLGALGGLGGIYAAMICEYLVLGILYFKKAGCFIRENI